MARSIGNIIVDNGVSVQANEGVEDDDARDLLRLGVVVNDAANEQFSHDCSQEGKRRRKRRKS